MIEYPTTVTNSKPGFDSGRVLYITKAEAFTPAELIQFMNEGFVPIAVTESSGMKSFSFASFGVVDGVYTLTIGETSYYAEEEDANFSTSGGATGATGATGQ